MCDQEGGGGRDASGVCDNAQHPTYGERGEFARALLVPRGSQASGRLQARPKVLTAAAVLVVDGIGYLPISRTGAMLFFQLMTRRYRHASTVLTSNKDFEDGGDVFVDEVMAPR